MGHVIRLRSTLALKGAMQRLAGQYQAVEIIGTPESPDVLVPTSLQQRGLPLT